MEDWTTDSLDLYWRTGLGTSLRELPDDSILIRSPRHRQLMQELVGSSCNPSELSGSVWDYFSSVVSGTRVLEDEIASCRVVWVSRGEVADPVFVMGVNS